MAGSFIDKYSSHGKSFDGSKSTAMIANFNTQVDICNVHDPVIASGAELWMRH
jgi:hypothetical protein